MQQESDDRNTGLKNKDIHKCLRMSWVNREKLLLNMVKMKKGAFSNYLGTKEDREWEQ